MPTVSSSVQPAIVNDLPIDETFMFADHKGRHRKSVEKRQSRLLRKLPPLKKLLDNDERILVVTTCCSPTSFFEQWLTGAIFIYLKRALLVVTDRRILHIPTKRDYSYRNSLAEIRYLDCAEIKLSLGRLTVSYKDGRKEKFLYIGRQERRKLKALLQQTELTGDPSENPRRAHLCPRCSSRLSEGSYLCGQCRLPFKSKEEARKWALLFPGGGYFYTRHPILGMTDALVELVLLWLVVDSLLYYLHSSESVALVELVFLSLILVFEKFVSVYHSNGFVDEYITEEKGPIYLT